MFWDSTERTYETMLHLNGKPAQILQADIQSTIHKLGKISKKLKDQVNLLNIIAI